jgi:hypothetical protein
MTHYWDTKFAMNLFGKNNETISSRSALEAEPELEATEQADTRIGQHQPLRLRRLMRV